MLNTSDGVDEDKLTKENNISLSRNPNDSFALVILDTSDKKDTFLIIQEEETP